MKQSRIAIVDNAVQGTQICSTYLLKFGKNEWDLLKSHIVADRNRTQQKFYEREREREITDKQTKHINYFHSNGKQKF